MTNAQHGGQKAINSSLDSLRHGEDNAQGSDFFLDIDKQNTSDRLGRFDADQQLGRNRSSSIQAQHPIVGRCQNHLIFCGPKASPGQFFNDARRTASGTEVLSSAIGTAPIEHDDLVSQSHRYQDRPQ